MLLRFGIQEMNDFTKQELVTLWLSLSGNSYPELKAKLQYLIDNYCEHEELFKGNDGWSKCKKCGEFYK